jgi:hypothetical protein
MTSAMLYADDASVVATYTSRDEALAALRAFVDKHPEVQDEIGLRAYEDGKPAGDFQHASKLVGEEALAQPHLLS